MNRMIDAVAACLLDARHRGQRVPTGFVDRHPLSARDGLAVQALVQTELGAVGGWKVSSSSTPEQPNFAAVPAVAIHPGGLAWPYDAFGDIAVECEIAFQIGRDLRSPPYTRDEVADAIVALMPLIEICESRLADYATASAGWRLADSGRCRALVTGRPCSDWQAVDPQALFVTLRLGGDSAAQRTGHPRADPVALVQSLANQVGEHCGGLRAGHIVTTGSMTGTLPVGDVADVLASFADLGDIRITRQR